MQKILFLLLVVVFSSVTVQAVTYSCRDNNGQLYMTDNLQSLPPECLGRTNTIQSQGGDNLNIVPGPVTPQGSEADFQEVVSAAAKAQKQRKEWLDGLLPRVEKVVEQYRLAVAQIYKTPRSGRIIYQDIVTRAKEQKQRAIEEKQKILAEISGSKVSPRDRAKITSLLDEIKD